MLNGGEVFGNRDSFLFVFAIHRGLTLGNSRGETAPG